MSKVYKRYLISFPVFPQSRLLSRYLPVRKDDFDLHGYIEAAGHNPDACFHLAITDKTCRGFLVKMGGKIKTWKKRWFVFDQNRRTLTYYAGGFLSVSKRNRLSGRARMFWLLMTGSRQSVNGSCLHYLLQTNTRPR